MSSIRERMKAQAKEGQGQSYTKLSPDFVLSVKEKDGKIGFSYYDKATKENKFIPKPIEGVLVGRCMSAEWFDPTIGQRGGTWATSFYYSKEKVVLFKPGSQGYEKVMEGNFDEIESYLRSRRVSANAKKAQVILVRMMWGKEPKTVAIKTNISIAITQLKRVDSDMQFDYYIKLTPKKYAEGEVDFDKKTTPATLNLMRTNPPKYASISFDKPINDVEFDSLGAESAIELFNKWLQEQKGSGGEATQTAAPAVPKDTIYNPPMYNNDVMDGFSPAGDNVAEEEESFDDLPF